MKWKGGDSKRGDWWLEGAGSTGSPPVSIRRFTKFELKGEPDYIDGRDERGVEVVITYRRPSKSHDEEFCGVIALQEACDYFMTAIERHHEGELPVAMAEGWGSLHYWMLQALPQGKRGLWYDGISDALNGYGVQVVLMDASRYMEGYMAGLKLLATHGAFGIVPSMRRTVGDALDWAAKEQAALVNKLSAVAGKDETLCDITASLDEVSAELTRLSGGSDGTVRQKEKAGGCSSGDAGRRAYPA